MSKTNYQLFSLYFQLTGGKSVSDALLAFDQLQICGPEDGDKYFEGFGVGNTLFVVDRPYERFLCYEFLLNQIQLKDINKFKSIHKGVPYFLLAWTAFEIRNYSKAVFYMDLALGEDIRKSTTNSLKDKIREALNNPGGNLWKLIPAEPAARIIQQLNETVVNTLNSFKNRTSEELLKNDFVDRFVVESIIKDEKNRSLISALYSYIVEAEDLLETLNIRSQNISSIEPYLMNLFKGGLIFETLLKLLSSQKLWSTQPTTLGGFVNHPDFLNFFSLAKGDFKTKATNISSVLSNALDDSVKTSFNTTAQLRNLSGHDLRRDDIFQNPDDYKKLVDKELNAIYFVIKKGFV